MKKSAIWLMFPALMTGWISFTAPLVWAETESAPPEQAEESPEPMSPIMDEPLSGQSIESFNAGLGQVKEKATAKEYQRLRGAIGYLKTYDLAAKADLATLYARLDGMSPREIVERASSQRGD